MYLFQQFLYIYLFIYHYICLYIIYLVAIVPFKGTIPLSPKYSRIINYSVILNCTRVKQRRSQQHVEPRTVKTTVKITLPPGIVCQKQTHFRLLSNSSSIEILDSRSRRRSGYALQPGGLALSSARPKFTSGLSCLRRVSSRPVPSRGVPPAFNAAPVPAAPAAASRDQNDRVVPPLFVIRLDPRRYSTDKSVFARTYPYPRITSIGTATRDGSTK